MGITNRYLIITTQELYNETNFSEADHVAEQRHTIDDDDDDHDYTGCPRRNVRDFGRVFLMLNYTDITQNTYVQSRTVTEIMAREKCGRHRCRNTLRRP